MLGVQYDSSSLVFEVCIFRVWERKPSLRWKAIAKRRYWSSRNVTAWWCVIQTGDKCWISYFHYSCNKYWRLKLRCIFVFYRLRDLFPSRNFSKKKKDSIVSNKKFASCKCFREKDIYLFRIFYFNPLHSLMFVKLSPSKLYVKTSKC